MAELPPGPRSWMPRDRWDALVRGEGCPLCRDVAAAVRVDEYGTTVADLEVSRLWLAANQSVPGYCVLICTRHVREPYELPPAESAAFFRDLLRAGRALEMSPRHCLLLRRSVEPSSAPGTNRAAAEAGGAVTRPGAAAPRAR